MLKMAAFSGLLMFAVFSLTISAPVDKRLQALNDTLSAIERLVRYYKSTFRELNIDGLFGLRVLEGQLEILLERFDKGENGGLSMDIRTRIQKLKQEATSISEEAVSFVKRGDEEYYKDLHFVVSRPWILWKSQRVLNFSTLWSHDVYFRNKKKLSESESDHCMTQLTGTLGKGSSAMCQIKEDCVELMTSQGLTGYGITHQILWSMLSEQAGCLNSMKALFEKHGRSVDDFQTEFCTNNFLEMIQTVHIILKENITPRFQDLFLEQQFVCPNIGFYEFLSSSYLYEIIHWQKESGCFGSMPRTVNSKEKNDFDYDYEDNTKKDKIPVQLQKQGLQNDSQNAVVVQKGQKLVQQFTNQDNKKVKPQDILTKPSQRGLLSFPDSRTFRSRKLLVEKAMSGGCLAHKTAVAAGALVMYLRYLIYPGSSDIFKNHAFIKSKLSAAKPLTDNEDIAYALAMGQTFKDIPKAILAKTAVKKQDHAMKANRTLLKNDYNQPGALNNNVLAAQLYGKTDKEEYYSNQKEKHEYYDDKNESPEYPKNDAKKPNQDVMVRFDNAKDDKNNYLDEDYKDEDYNEKGDDKEEEEDVKNEDRDYPYYDVNQRKQQEEADRIEREDKDQFMIKRDKGGQPDPVGGVGEKVVIPSKPDGPSLGTVMMGFSAVFCVLLFFVYRFIKSRRVHIHYSLRSLMRRM